MLLDMSFVDFTPLPDSEHHVCFFRQALALDERRGRFQPICALGDVHAAIHGSNNEHRDPSIQNSESTNGLEHNPGGKNLDPIPHIKEVWFPGTHSQMSVGIYVLGLSV